MTYAFLPRLPLSPLRVLARLACLIHAANVHSEPGSNPSIWMLLLLDETLASPCHQRHIKQQISDLERFVADWANFLFFTDASPMPEDIKHSSESSRNCVSLASRTATPTVAHSNQIVKEHKRKTRPSHHMVLNRVAFDLREF